MDFSITPDQRLMQDSLVRTLAGASSLDRVRRFAGDPDDKGADIHAALADFGLTGIVIPEEFGGLGRACWTPPWRPRPWAGRCHRVRSWGPMCWRR